MDFLDKYKNDNDLQQYAYIDSLELRSKSDYNNVTTLYQDERAYNYEQQVLSCNYKGILSGQNSFSGKASSQMNKNIRKNQ